MRLRPSTTIATAVVVSLACFAPPARSQLTADEAKCQQGTSLAVGKFIGAKAKCLIKCEQGARKGVNSSTDCTPPAFGGATQTCVASATTKWSGFEQSKCAKDCPECYTGGDCAADSTARIADAETQLDALALLVYCDDSASPDGLNPSEAKCQDTVAKTLANFAAKKLNCYAKCRKAEEAGKITPGSCTPPATDQKTADCISKEETKAATLIDKKCDSTVNPSADAPECFGTQTGAGWAALVESGVDGGQASLYCASPSGAFLD